MDDSMSLVGPQSYGEVIEVHMRVEGKQRVVMEKPLVAQLISLVHTCCCARGAFVSEVKVGRDLPCFSFRLLPSITYDTDFNEAHTAQKTTSIRTSSFSRRTRHASLERRNGSFR